MVDANSGEILEKLNQLTDVTGDGNVYPTHPGLSSVTNKPLYGLVGNGYLDGTYVDVQNASASEAYSSSHSFKYSTSNTHFEEVSLYFHIDNFRRNFVEGLDASNDLFNKLTATAHDNSTCPNNACFSSSTQDLYFSDGYPFAKEDKVVHHEYGHAVIYDIQSGIQSTSSEEGAISEGTPDYFSGSFTNRSRILEYAVPFAERDMANPDISSYSDYKSDPSYPNVAPHTGGEFFSAILWDLRNTIGASVADFLVYDALYRITGGPDFLEFRDAVIAADDAAYGGANYEDIRNTFAEWGIGTAIVLTVSIGGPHGVNDGQTGYFTANVSNADGSVDYQWYYRQETYSSWIADGGNSSSYSRTFYSAPGGGTAHSAVKVEITSAGESASDIHSVDVYGCQQGVSSNSVSANSIIPC